MKTCVETRLGGRGGHGAERRDGVEAREESGVAQKRSWDGGQGRREER